MAELTIYVYDIETSVGIPNLNVYLFAGGGGLGYGIG